MNYDMNIFTPKDYLIIFCYFIFNEISKNKSLIKVSILCLLAYSALQQLRKLLTLGLVLIKNKI